MTRMKVITGRERNRDDNKRTVFKATEDDNLNFWRLYLTGKQEAEREFNKQV